MFVETMMFFSFFLELLMARKFQHLFDIDKCLSVTVTFDQFNVSLLKKGVFQVRLQCSPQLITVYCVQFNFSLI